MPSDSIRRTALGHWIVDGDTGVGNLVEAHATFEHPENLRQIAAAALAIPDGGVVIDAGACIGDQTVTYSQLVGAEGMVYAFEPHPVAYRALVKNTARLSNVHPRNAALSDTRGSAELRLTPNVGASYLDGNSAEDWPIVRVETVLLDDCRVDRRLGRCDFIHLDAEGMESRILKGAEHLIRYYQPTLLVEVTDQWLRRYGSSALELLQQIASYGYFTMTRLQPNPSQFDVVAMPMAKMAEIAETQRKEAVHAS